jgi:Uma2 family endonuclease
MSGDVSPASSTFTRNRRGTDFAMDDDATMSVMPGDDHAKSGVKLTYDDYLLFPEDGKRHELIDGEHYVTPSPNLRHQEISGRFYLMIGSWLETHPVGRVFYAPLDVIFSRHDVVEPDLLYASHERARTIMTGNWVTGAPELVVEIGSPTTRARDETIKRRLYERFGVLEYWVVDPVHEVVFVSRRDADAFAAPIELARERGDVLRTALLDGLALPLERIFATAGDRPHVN